MINPGNKERRTGVSGRDLATPVAANRKVGRKQVLQVSVILAHPRRGSFNHAIAETVVAELCRNGHSVRFHDLHREGFGDPLDAIWKKCVFDLCGVKKVHRTVFSVVVTSTKEQRSEWLSDVRATVGRPESWQGTHLLPSSSLRPLHSPGRLSVDRTRGAPPDGI